VAPYLEQVAAWQSLWPFPIAVAIISAIVSGVAGGRAANRRVGLPAAAFCALGLVIGYTTAFSRDSAVGTVLPAVLTLIGGVAVVLMRNDEEARTLVCVCVLVFSAGLLVGITWGAVMRGEALAFAQSEAELKRRADIEALVRKHRKALGIDPEKQCDCDSTSGTAQKLTNGASGMGRADPHCQASRVGAGRRRDLDQSVAYHIAFCHACLSHGPTHYSERGLRFRGDMESAVKGAICFGHAKTGVHQAAISNTHRSRKTKG
jgi:hypothetical protein